MRFSVIDGFLESPHSRLVSVDGIMWTAESPITEVAGVPRDLPEFSRRYDEILSVDPAPTWFALLSVLDAQSGTHGFTKGVLRATLHLITAGEPEFTNRVSPPAPLLDETELNDFTLQKPFTLTVFTDTERFASFSYSVGLSRVEEILVGGYDDEHANWLKSAVNDSIVTPMGEQSRHKEFSKYVSDKLDALVYEIRVDWGQLHGIDVQPTVDLVAGLRNELIALAEPGSEGLIGQLGMVQAAWRRVVREAPALVTSRVQAIFSEAAFQSLLGNTVNFGLGFVGGALTKGGF